MTSENSGSASVVGSAERVDSGDNEGDEEGEKEGSASVLGCGAGVGMIVSSVVGSADGEGDGPNDPPDPSSVIGTFQIGSLAGRDASGSWVPGGKRPPLPPLALARILTKYDAV
jgi:hypothetical protein